MTQKKLTDHQQELFKIYFKTAQQVNKKICQDWKVLLVSEMIHLSV